MSTSPALELSGFAITAVGPSDEIDSVTATVNAWTADTRTGPLTYELHDGKTGALIGSAAGTVCISSSHYDTVTFPAPAWAQLHWLQLWIFAGSGTAPSGTVVSVDYAALAVAYVPSGIPFAAPVAGTAAAAGTAPDATGPSGRVFIDIDVSVGPTASRSQVSVAAVTQGDGMAAGVVRGDGTGAAPSGSRAQAGVAAVTQGDGMAAGLVTADRRA